MFLAGLMDWSGDHPPSSDDLIGKTTLAQGAAYLTETGREIIGCRDLALGNLGPAYFLDQSPDPPSCRLQQGFKVLGIATPAERREYKTLSTWGFMVIAVLAEKRFGGI